MYHKKVGQHIYTVCIIQYTYANIRSMASLRYTAVGILLVGNEPWCGSSSFGSGKPKVYCESKIMCEVKQNLIFSEFVFKNN